MEEKYIAAIDLGTSKIALTVAKINGNDIQIVYYRETPSEGIRYSHVFNPKKASEPLKNAISQAEDELKIKIFQAVIGMPRYFVRQESDTTSIDRSNPNIGISVEEVESVKSIVTESHLTEEDELIYGAIAQSFSTEDCINQSENDIIGITGNTLEGNFKIFIGPKKQSDNIDLAINEIGIAIAKKYFIPAISARAILSEEETENGVALIDFGAGATSVTIYRDKLLRYYASIPFGGKIITSDIKSECNINERLAENIKLAYGACMPEKLQNLNEKILQIENENGVPTRQLPIKYLSEVVTSRVREIIDAILYKIQESGYADMLRNGIVLTGGGSNLLNCSNFIKEISGYNVRIGYPKHFFSSSGCNEIYSAGATASISMILAAKNDNIINCTDTISAIKPEEKVKKEQNIDTEGTLISPEEFGENISQREIIKEKVKRKVKDKNDKNPLKIAFGTISNLFDSTKEEI